MGRDSGSESDKIMDRKAELLARIIRTRVGCGTRNGLVVGCGSGQEAAILAQVLGAAITGIDLNTNFCPVAARVAQLQWGDAENLAFADNSFDLVYSYHALEHVCDHRRAIGEMRRVLKNYGWYCIGVPNRSRIIGYLGAIDTSVTDKIKWNIVDWKAKLTGRFRNELGAHAGFTLAELTRDVGVAIGYPKDITLEYYLTVYPRFSGALRVMSAVGLGRFLFPAIYLIGRKGEVH